MGRDAYRLEQTPQTFRASLLRRAYEQPYCEVFTDDASVAPTSVSCGRQQVITHRPSRVLPRVSTR